MLFLALLLSTALGISLVSAISHQFTWLEKIGLSFIVGIGVQTFLMTLLDFVGIPLTIYSIVPPTLVLTGIALFFGYKQKNNFTESLGKLSFKSINYKQYTVLWLIVLGILGYVEYLNLAKCMYFPTFDRDALVVFDFVGRVIANEHCMAGSSYFTNPTLLAMEGGNYLHYTPLVQLSYAYCYIFGAETSKIIPALFYLSLLITLYAVLRRKLNPTLSILAVLFTALVPEFIAFSSLSATNAIHAVYASLAILYAWLYFEDGKKKDFWLTVILSGLNIWTRQEGIVFAAAIMFVLLIKALKNKQFKDLIIYTGIAVGTFLIWIIYLKISKLGSQTSSMNIIPVWDGEKASKVCSLMFALLKSTVYYSLTFYIAGIALLISAYFIIKERKYELPFLAIVSFLVFCVLIYQVDYNWDSIENVINYSCKRFLFCFIPLSWAFVFTNPVSMKVNNYMNKLSDNK